MDCSVCNNSRKVAAEGETYPCPVCEDYVVWSDENCRLVDGHTKRERLIPSQAAMRKSGKRSDKTSSTETMSSSAKVK